MYTTIIHPLRKALHLSCNEYCVLDSIHRLCNNTESPGWCCVSRQKMADYLDLSKQTIIIIIDNLEVRGYIEKNSLGHTKSTKGIKSLFNPESDINLYRLKEDDAFIMVDKYFTDGKETLPMVKKFDQTGKETLPKNPKIGKKTLPYKENTNKDIYIDNIPHKKLIRTNKPFNGSKQNISKSKNDKYRPIARKLFRIIEQYRKEQKYKPKKYSDKIISTWSNQIRLLSEQDNIPISRINESLNWYKSHIGGRYIPVIESGESLRKKFEKLENAIKREKEDKKPPKANTTGYYNDQYKFRKVDRVV